MGDPIDPGPHLGPPWPSRAGRRPGRGVGDEVGAAQLTARSGCQTENAQLRKTSTGSWPGLTQAQGKGHRLRAFGGQKQDRWGKCHACRHPALGRTDVSMAGLVSGPRLEPTALGGGKRLVIGQDDRAVDHCQGHCSELFCGAEIAGEELKLPFHLLKEKTKLDVEKELSS